MSSEKRIQLTATPHSVDGEVDYDGVVALLVRLGPAGESWRVTGTGKLVNAAATENVRVYTFDSSFVSDGTGSVSASSATPVDITAGYLPQYLSITAPGTGVILCSVGGFPEEGTLELDIDLDLVVKKL